MVEEAAQTWHPTHVQVTVLEARDLHPKGKHGSNDTYTVMQLGAEKYCTSVAEKSLCPVWKEEAAFELPALPAQHPLQLTAMHRSLLGPDRFLGRVSLSLSGLYDQRERRKTRWYQLESKQGKRNKERGQLKVSVQFMRHNMTASMFDLSAKEKTRSPFSRLKDKMKGRKADGCDTSSAIIPSTRDLHRDHNGPETQLRTKPKKPFLLGPQRLSTAHSMSDLTPPPRTTAPATLGAISSAGEGGSLKSPHRRTMSADTKDKPLEDNAPGMDWMGGSGNAPGMDWMGGSGNNLVLGASMPHKFATLPRQWAPSDEHHEVMGSSGSLGLSSKPAEGKKDGKKKDKVSLFERVTGKKEGKRPDRHSQEISEWGVESRTPDTQISTNPFRVGSHLPEQGSYMKFSPSDGSVTAQPRSHQRGLHLFPALHGPSEMNPFEGGGAYTHLTRTEVERELSKHKELLKKKDSHIRELEDYIDNLLVRVMEETPGILRVPYVPSRKAGKFSQS